MPLSYPHHRRHLGTSPFAFTQALPTVVLQRSRQSFRNSFATSPARQIRRIFTFPWLKLTDSYGGVRRANGRTGPISVFSPGDRNRRSRRDYRTRQSEKNEVDPRNIREGHLSSARAIDGSLRKQKQGVAEAKESSATRPPVTSLVGIVQDLRERDQKLRERASKRRGRDHDLRGRTETTKARVRPKFISLTSWPQDSCQKDKAPALSSLPNSEQFPIEQPASPEYSGQFNLALTASQPSNTGSPALAIQSPPTFDIFFPSWSRRFHAMSSMGKLDLIVSDHSSIRPLLEDYAPLNTPTKEIRQTWEDVTPTGDYSPLQVWEDVMLWCLLNNHTRAIKLLLATIGGKNDRPPRYMVGDCLEYLANERLRSEAPNPWVLRTLYQLTCEYIWKGEGMMERTVFAPDSLICLLLRRSGNAEARNLVEVCISNNVTLHANTLLHIVNKSIEWGTVSLSMSLLQAIVASGFNLSQPQVQSACVKLLRSRFNTDNEYAIQTKIVTQLLEMGIVPGIAMYNAIILNTIEAGDFDTAWQMYDVARANKMRPDSITYGVLLKAALLSEDFDMMDKVLREVLDEPSAMTDLRLLNDVLIATSRQSIRSNLAAYPRLLNLYRKYCRVAPVIDLGICKPDARDPNFRRQQPTTHVLAQMICSYTQMHRGSKDLINVYNRYRELVLQGYPVVSRLAQEDYVANAFIVAFGYNPTTLKHCTTVVKHMLEKLPEATRDRTTNDINTSIDASQDSTSSTARSLRRTSSDAHPNLVVAQELLAKQPKYCPPTVRTWSVLAAAYFRNNQKHAAAKVITLMRDRGIRPDRIHWNTIISGYAGMQDVGAAVDTVERMQAAGYETNAETLQGLGRLWDRNRLLDALKKVKEPLHASPQPGVERAGEKMSVEVVTHESEEREKMRKEAERYLNNKASH